jgi:uncharacterized OsmC-like protein
LEQGHLLEYTMAMQEIAVATQRARKVFERRPEAGLHDDAPATARWQGGLRVVASHANGTRVETDMPAELGGTGDRVTPGWMFRAGIASCAATTIATAAAEQGIRLERLELKVCSRSDARGMFGMVGSDGAPVPATPQDMTLQVSIAARDVTPERLRTLVRECCRQSPIPCAVQAALPLAIEIETPEA